MNITDVDDKTIRGSREAGVPLNDFTRQFKRAFLDDLDTLRIKRADLFPEATDPKEIAAMIAMIRELIARGLAYRADDHSVYYRIRNFPDYGRLAHLHLDELQSTGRVKNDEYEKEDIGDFALWKAWDEADGAVAWDAPWGRGRPGWHIECSAMAMQSLGQQIDLHCGGVDNIFPHHEAEIAQSEGVTGRRFVRYWLHCAHLLVEGQKMSKSLGNFHTLRDLLARGYTGREVRFALIRVHYRAPLNFTWEGMEEAREALRRIDEWVGRVREAASARTSHAEGRTSHFERPRPEDGFAAALDEDLNISGALGALFDKIRETNRALDAGEMSSADAKRWLDWWDAVLQVSGSEAAIPAEVLALGEARTKARAAKDWKKSDELRDELWRLGWEARDTKDGQKLMKRGA
jgi:cysteinyl-tRNA synthetase